MVVGWNVAPVITGAILLGLASGVPVIAAPTSVDRGVSRIADADQVRPVATSETDEEPAACGKSRKRLWIEGDGWVVRKVTSCR